MVTVEAGGSTDFVARLIAGEPQVMFATSGSEEPRSGSNATVVRSQPPRASAQLHPLWRTNHLTVYRHLQLP